MYMFALSRHLNLVFRDRKRDMLSKRIWIIDSRAQVKTFVFTDLFCLGETIKKILFVISTLRKRQRESCFMNKLKTVSSYECEQKRFRKIYSLLAKIKERRYDKIYKAIRAARKKSSFEILSQDYSLPLFRRSIFLFRRVITILIPINCP